MNVFNSLRLEARLRNNVLWHLIFDNYKSVRDFSQQNNYYESEVGLLLNLKKSPILKKHRKNSTDKYYAINEYKQGRHYIKLCLDLSKQFGILVEDLFPIGIYNLPLIEQSYEIPFSYLPKQQIRELTYEDINEPKINMKNKIKKILLTLPMREKEIIEKRYGFYGEPMLLEELANEYAVSKERIRQIEKKALRRVKHRINLADKISA